MITFDRTLGETEKIIKKWVGFPLINQVTIIRDVYGKIALLLDMMADISELDERQLENELKSGLQDYFRGRIYYKAKCTDDLKRAIVNEIENMRISTNEDGKWYLVERAVAKKAWIDCRSDEPAIWTYEDAKNGIQPKVVTFYSFKGGMGRTTALAATALCLAKQGKNVLMIDTDIEAPGLASLFMDEAILERGVVDYMLERSQSSGMLDMADYMKQIIDPVLIQDIRGKIFLVPAGKIDQYYLQKLARIDFQESLPGSLKTHICQLIHDAVDTIQPSYKVDYVLLDARAGFHDMGGVVTTQIPHGVVMFGKNSRQSWQGIRHAVKAVSSVQADTPMLAIVDSSCGNDEQISPEEKQEFIREAHTICSEYYYNETNQPAIGALGEAHSPIFVWYRPALSGGFALFSTGEKDNEENLKRMKSILLGKEYQLIAARIMQWFGDSEGVRKDG